MSCSRCCWRELSCPHRRLQARRAQYRSDWESLGGYLTSSPAAVSWGNGRIDVFVRGGDFKLHHIACEGQWHSWHSFDGLGLFGGPAVSSWEPGRVDVFYENENSDFRHRTYAGGTWRGPFHLLGDLWSDTARLPCTGHDRTVDVGPEVSVLPVPGTMD